MTDAEPELHFLAGVSRAGITWLSRALNRHPEVAVFGQSRFWGKHYIEPDHDGFYQAQHVARLVSKIVKFEWDATIGRGEGCFPDLSLDEFRELLVSSVREVATELTPRSAFVAMATAVAKHKGARLVIEKTPHHILHADRIHLAFPNARLLLLWCDARTHMAVLKLQSGLTYHPIAAALIWRKYERAIRHELETRPTQAMLVDCAGLADDAEQGFRAIGDFLGVAEFDWIEGVPAYDYSLADGRLPTLTSCESYWSQKVNGAEAAAELDWSVVASGLTLPLFVAKNVAETSRDLEGSMLRYYTRWLTAKDL